MPAVDRLAEGRARGRRRRRWRDRLRALTTELRTLVLLARDRRLRWPARLLAGAVVAYAASPIDLIPDVIPVLGYLDDVVVVGLGVAFVLRLADPAVVADCRARARGERRQADGSPAGSTSS